MFMFPVSDVATGHLAALGIMLALLHRTRTGEGQAVSASLSQTATLLQAPTMIDHPGRVWQASDGQQSRGWSDDNRLYGGRDDRWFYVVADGTRDLDVAALTPLSATDAVDLQPAQGHSAHVVATSAEVGRLPRPGFPAAGHPGVHAADIITELGLADHWAELVNSGAIVHVE